MKSEECLLQQLNSFDENITRFSEKILVVDDTAEMREYAMLLLKTIAWKQIPKETLEIK